MNIKGILRGTILAYVITAIVLLGAAVAAYFNFIGGRPAGIAVFAGAVLSVFVGGLSAAKTAGSKKLFNSLAVSLIFAATLAAAAYILNGSIIMHASSAALLGSVIVAGTAAALIA